MQDPDNKAGGLLRRLLEHRFLKFGTVGASGTVVNMATLFVMQEYVLTTLITDPERRLTVSLGIAILCATVNNFSWNRVWTWRDRGDSIGAHPLVQFIKYASACWLGILIQFALTKWLAGPVHYLVANLFAIAFASVFNFLINDYWTFEGLRLRKRTTESAKAPARLEPRP
jgi:putative flippase GtrA